MGVTRSCKMVLLRLGFLLPQGSHPVSVNLKPSVPLEVFLSSGHVDVEGFLEWQFSRVFGSSPGCLALSTTVATSHLME